MRGVYAFFVLASGLNLATADDRLIPFDHFYISIDTNWRAAKGGEGEALKVDVRVSRSDENPSGSTRIEVSCSGFDSNEREFSGSDLETLFEAFEAAGKSEPYEKEILSPTLFGRVKTRFTGATAGMKPIVRVVRGKAEVYFTLAEAEHTKEALALARVAEEWYKRLLTETKLPAITPEAHPPPSQDLYLSSTVGRVSGGGFDFEIGVRASRPGPGAYHIKHGIGADFPGWWTEGSWVENLLATVAKAIDAGKAGHPFKHPFDSGRHRNKDAIFITVNSATGHAEVMVKFGEGLLSDKPVAFGTFGETELEAIRKLEAEAELRKKWFEDHESLFRVPPPKDP